MLLTTAMASTSSCVVSELVAGLAGPVTAGIVCPLPDSLELE
jgi:hypothetical protein